MRNRTGSDSARDADEVARFETLERRILLHGVGDDRPQPGSPPPGAPEGTVEYLVRTAYLIPSNRAPQDGAVERLQQAMRWFQDWYRDQMERNGFGPKTFVYETEADTVTPKVHITNLPNTDSYYRDDANNGAETWGRVLTDAGNAGLSIWGLGHVWMLVYEAHEQLPDSSLRGGFFGGASFGSGSDGGVALLDSASLALLDPENLADNRTYDGLVFPQLGPHPMVQDVTYPWFLGDTVSSLGSSFFGGYIHEVTHGFGIGHNYRNDVNFHGNLMGNGHRGFRGNLYPARYPDQIARLDYGFALALNSSRYFNAGATFGDDVRRTITDVTSGAVTPINGSLHVSFSASDASGLASALLYRSGDLVAELPLSGTSFSGTFVTPWYEPAVANQFTVTVYDVYGNRQNTDVTITPAAGHNRAPQPFVKLNHYTPMVGQDVLIEAWWSTDPDHPTSALVVEWDLDGDGVFDTPPSSVLGMSHSFDAPGLRFIQARLTDPDGAQSLSQPLAVRVVPVDTTPPTVSASEFVYRTAPHELRFTFSEDVWGSFSLDHITVENLSTATTIPAASMNLALGANHTARLRFPDFVDGILPDGNYRATLLAAGITDAAGNPLPQDHVFDFRFLMADANNDGVVNLADFNILASNFGQAGPHIDFSKGDFNYDGVVNLADFNILAGRFGVVLGSPGAGVASGAFSESRVAEDRSNDDTLADVLS